jgi:hypothetical protein
VFRLAQRLSNCGARPPGGDVSPFVVGGGDFVIRGTSFILNEIWAQGKIYFDRNFVWFNNLLIA